MLSEVFIVIVACLEGEDKGVMPLLLLSRHETGEVGVVLDVLARAGSTSRGCDTC